jgi:hypothetical protein
MFKSFQNTEINKKTEGESDYGKSLAKMISITIISDLPMVRTGGPHNLIPLETKK